MDDMLSISSIDYDYKFEPGDAIMVMVTNLVMVLDKVDKPLLVSQL